MGDGDGKIHCNQDRILPEPYILGLDLCKTTRVLISRVIPVQMGHARKIQPAVLTAVVSEDSINEPLVEPPEGPCVPSADPAIVFLQSVEFLSEFQKNPLSKNIFNRPLQIKRLKNILSP